MYDTSVQGAYESGLRLQNDPMRLGPLLRGLHRYAADAAVLLVLLHLIRETVQFHFLGARWFSWQALACQACCSSPDSPACGCSGTNVPFTA